MTDQLKLFSVDDHIIEPPEVWTSRLPAKFRDEGPRVVREDGHEYWVYEDRRNDTMGLNAVAGKPKEAWNMDAVSYDDMLPGCYDPAARAVEFRAEGIVGSVLVPTLPGFGGRLFSSFKDKELANLCVKAYNDFVIDEWCPADPALYVPSIIVQIWDPKLAAAEIERCAAKGARTAFLPDNPVYLDLPSFHQMMWEPMWRALEATDMVVSLHSGGSGRMPLATPESNFAAAIIGGPGTLGIEKLTDLLTSDIVIRHPSLQFVLTEDGAGWVPYLLERADLEAELHAGWWKHDERPSDVFRRQFNMCLVNERFAVEQRYRIGVDNLLWEYDYPHAECPYGEAQKHAAEQLADIPQEDVDKISHGNAARIFRWPV